MAMRRPRIETLLPFAALALGAWVVLTGVAHTVGVLRVALDEGKPYDLRLASLLGLGLTLVFAGLLQAGASRGLRAGARWARLLSAASALFVAGHVLLLAPILAAWGLLALQAAHLVLLALHPAWRASPAREAAVDLVSSPGE